MPISNIASYPYILCVANSAPARTVQELIEYAKANPDRMNAGGASAIFQLTTELFKQKTGTSIQYIQFRGSNDAVVALVSGQLQLSFVDSGPAAAQIKGGQLRPLAVTSAKRLASLPDVPTMQEAGISGMEIESWSGLFAPRGTPIEVVHKLQNAVIAATAMPDIQRQLQALDLEAVGSTSEQFVLTMAKDIERWRSVAASSNIKIER